MNKSKFWKPVIYSLIATPVCLILAFLFASAGHGNYFLVKLLFPYTMLSTLIFGSITIPFIILAIAQIPFYGLVFGAANAKDKFIPLAVPVFVRHILAVIACLLFIGESFS